MICASCGEYYRKSQYNTTEECKAVPLGLRLCDNCADQIEPTHFDDEDQTEINYLINPSGVTKAVYIE